MYGVSWFVGYFIRIIRLLVGFVVLGFREPKYSERWGVAQIEKIDDGWNEWTTCVTSWMHSFEYASWK